MSQYCCDECFASLARKNNTYRHWLSYHLLNTAYLSQIECDDCSASFGLKSSLLRHWFCVHPQTEKLRVRSFRPFTCGLCFVPSTAAFPFLKRKRFGFVMNAGRRALGVLKNLPSITGHTSVVLEDSLTQGPQWCATSVHRLDN